VVRRIFNQRVNGETMIEQLAAGKTFDQLMGTSAADQTLCRLEKPR
jgi:hypothetical protein